MASSDKPPEARKTPKQQRSQQTRLDLLGGATRVLKERGSAGLTTNHVAERAGVSVGSLYQYYPNKGALLADLHAEEGARLWSELAPVLRDETRDVAERLRVVMEAVFGAQAAATEHHAALDAAGVDVLESDELEGLRAQFQAELESVLVSELGRSASEAAGQAAFCVMAIVGLMIQLGKGSGDVERARALARESAQMLAAYLRVDAEANG